MDNQAVTQNRIQEIQAQQFQHLTTIQETEHLTPKEVEIAVIVFGVNYVLPFPMKDDMIEAWAKIINEERPKLNLDRLRLLIRHAQLEKFSWNPRKGIQNIFVGLTYCNENADYSNISESFYR